MKTIKKRSRKLMRVRNRDRVNRIKKQHLVLAPLFVLVLIKLGLSSSDTPEAILARLRFLILMLTGNANFPVIDPTLVQLQAKADELQAAKDAAMNGDRLLIEQRNIVQAEGEDMIRSLSWDIQKKSGGVADKIHSAGFATRDEKSPPVLPGKVQNVKAVSTGEGKIKLRWKKDPHARVYVVKKNEGNIPIPPLKWVDEGHSFKASIEFTDLNPGQMYFFEVQGVNQVGVGEVSEVANARCL